MNGISRREALDLMKISVVKNSRSESTPDGNRSLRMEEELPKKKRGAHQHSDPRAGILDAGSTITYKQASGVQRNQSFIRECSIYRRRYCQLYVRRDLSDRRLTPLEPFIPCELMRPYGASAPSPRLVSANLIVQNVSSNSDGLRVIAWHE
jgi:hypothetical protein